MSGLPPFATVERTSRFGSFVPTAMVLTDDRQVRFASHS
jgi:hypothetical protein